MMKALKTATAIVGILGLGVMAVTNPAPAAYHEYATEKLTTYAKDNYCQKVKVVGFLKTQCDKLLDENQAQIEKAVAQKTTRHNFILFSIYTTDLAIDLSSFGFLPSNIQSWLFQALPSYRIKTVGAMQNFYTYEAQENSTAPAIPNP